MSVSLKNTYSASGKVKNFWIQKDGGSNNYRNLSLTTLKQSIPHFFELGTANPTISDDIIGANCGNINGRIAGTDNYSTDTLKNISLKSFSDWATGVMPTRRGFGYDFNNSYPVVTYKYVPTGFDVTTSPNGIEVGNYSDAKNWRLQGATASDDVGMNYPGVNLQLANYYVPQSASFGLRILNTQSLVHSEMPFSGCITTDGTNSSYAYCPPYDQGGRIVPPGSGSAYKASWNGITVTILHQFWVWCELPDEFMCVYCTDMPASNLGNGAWSPNAGISVWINSDGKVWFMKGDTTGNTITSRRVFKSVGTINSHDGAGTGGVNYAGWNCIMIRASNTSNSTAANRNNIMIFNNRGGGSWKNISGCTMNGGGADTLKHTSDGHLVYSPGDILSAGYNTFSGSIGHHYIMLEGVTGWHTQMTNTEWSSSLNITNSGSDYLYGPFSV